MILRFSVFLKSDLYYILPLFGRDRINPAQKLIQYKVSDITFNIDSMSTHSYRLNQARNVTSKKYDLCGYYSEMIKKCEQKIRTVINQLALIYKQYQVSFSVFQHQESIMRLLIPVEFKSYIDNSIYFMLQNRRDAHGLINTVRFNDMSNFYDDQISHDKDERLNKSESIPVIDKKQIQRLIEEKTKGKILPKSNQSDEMMQSVQQERFNIKRQGNLTNYPFSNSQPMRKPGVRSRGLQNLLCNWIINECQRGYPVSRADVIEKAKQIGKESNLKGSAGWYSNFIRRNPDIRKILSRGNIQRKRAGYQKDTKDVKNEEFMESSNSFHEIGNGIYDDEENDGVSQDKMKRQGDSNSYADYNSSQSQSEERKDS